MTIDINDLREKITIKGLDVVADTDILEILDRLEATEEDRSTFLLEMGKLCAQCDALRLRIEAAEKERDELLAGLDEWLDKTKWVQQGSNEGTISAKYLGLHRADVMTSLLGEAEKERDALRVELNEIRYGVAVAHDTIKALRAKIAEMEQQEPVAWTTKLALEYGASTLGFRVSSVNIWGEQGVPLYALPGAQTAPSVRDGWKLVPIDPTEDMLRAMTDPFVAINGDNRKAFESAYTAMLAAAPEAKP